MNFFDSTLIYPIFDVESIGDGPRVPRAHLEVVLTQLLAARARALGTGCVPFSDWIWSLWAALSARVRPCGLGECC